MTEPTQQDIDNAALRAGIAARFRREFEEAKALAESVFGPGWEPTGRHDLVTHAEASAARHEGRRMTPSASVITAQNGSGERRHFRVTEGGPVEVESYPQGFGAMLTEPDTERTIEVRGESVHPHKYELVTLQPFELAFRFSAGCRESRA
ncbi:MAG: hypothetical protein K2V38_17250 [Gemmataceae bacterium]|nr:hypothetical protein [Gemmataceae bacterium]